MQRQYIPLIEELVKRALSKKLSYTARIVFRNGEIYLHLSVPIELYLKYFSKGKPKSSLIAGFDLNSDRVNMVIVSRFGIIRDVKTWWFPEVTSHGFPRNKANALRLQALARLLDYAYHHGVSVVIFEDLDRIKKRKYTRSRTANRKITRFPKRKLLQHGTVMALKYGFKVYFVNPTYTSKIGKGLGLDKHTASAYALIVETLHRSPESGFSWYLIFIHVHPQVHHGLHRPPHHPSGAVLGNRRSPINTSFLVFISFTASAYLIALKGLEP